MMVNVRENYGLYRLRNDSLEAIMESLINLVTAALLCGSAYWTYKSRQ